MRVHALAAGLLGLAPAALVLRAGDRALGAYSFDQAGHIWTMWHATVEPLTTTVLLNHPTGLDLMPALGGWADIVLGASLSAVFSLEVSYNIVIGLYLWLAGLGGYALARTAGVGLGPALVAGWMLQTEPTLLRHAGHGQVEQVGLGLVALAIAGAIHCWRTPSWPLAAATGAAGAAVVYACWEYAFLLAGAMLVLTPGIVSTGFSRSAVRRWALAAGTTALLAGPWVAAFLQRTAGVRSGDDDGFNLINAAQHALPILDWLLHAPHAGPLLLLPLLALPWTARASDRRLWAAVAVGLLVAAALALGPAPRLAGPPRPDAAPLAWAPFSLVQQVPVLGWYHWPDRVMLLWPLALAPAVALLIARLARWRRAVGLGLALLVVGRWGMVAHESAPEGKFALPADPAVRQLADVEGSGAVLDLPVDTSPQSVLRYQMFQTQHGRPLLLHSFPNHLHYGEAAVLASPIVRWSRGAVGPAPDVSGLRAAGVGFVTLHKPWMRGPQFGRARQALKDALGPPLLESPQWACWAL